MNNKTKINAKALFKGLSFTLIAFLAPSAAIADDPVYTPSYNLTEVSSPASGLNITKYEADASGNLVAVDYNLSLKENLGGDYTSENLVYLKWNEDGSALIDITADVEAGTASADDADLSIYGNGLTAQSSNKGGDELTALGNYVGSSADQKGGAYYVAKKTSLTSIGIDFVNNTGGLAPTEDTQGGAFYFGNASGTAANVDGNFISNKIAISSDYAFSAGGGAIYNAGSISGYFLSDFISNSVSSYVNAQGGAIYNNKLISAYLSGSFVSNYAVSNSDSADNFARGGAIYTVGTMSGLITTDFINNYALASGLASAQGGAIYNTGTISGGIVGDIFSNYASSTTGTAQGGAVYNTGSILFASDADNDYVYAGNWAGASKDSLSSTDDANGGFLYQEEGGSTVFSTDTNSSITIGTGTAGYDSIAGLGSIEKTGDGELIINSSMTSYEGSLTVSGGVLSTSADNFANMSSITNDATIDFTGGTLSNSNFTNNGTLQISGEVSSSVEITGSLAFNLTTSTDVSLSLSGDATITWGGVDIYLSASTSITDDITLISGANFGSDLDLSDLNIYLDGTLLEDYSDSYTVSVDENGNLVFGSVSTEPDVDDSKPTYTPSYTLSNLGDDDVASGFAITKYEFDNTTNSIVAVKSDLTFSSALGETENAEATKYSFNWTLDDNGNLVLEATSDENADLTIHASSTGATSNSGSYTHSTVNTISGEGNMVTSGGVFTGNAVFDSITGDFVNNHVTSLGGVIYVRYGKSTSNVTANFIGNSAGTSGGAIYTSTSAANVSSYIRGYIIGDFIGNYAGVSGGAIYSAANTIISADITGSFINNYVYGAGNVLGGAIYNEGSISTDENDSVGTGLVTADFINNYVYTTSTNKSAQGGAIYNVGSISTGIAGDIFSNYAYSAYSAQGGAVYNSGDVKFVATGSSDFYYVGNYATTTDLSIDGNSLSSADDANGGFLYQEEGGSTIFSTDKNASITIGDGREGYDSIAGFGSIEKTGEGALIINSSMLHFEGALNINEGSMKFSNLMNSASTVTVGTSGSLTIVINSANFGETILGSLSGAGDVYISFDTSSLASVDLSSSTSIYDKLIDFTGDILWDSSLTANDDDSVTISIGGKDYIVSVDTNGEMSFVLDSDSGTTDPDPDPDPDPTPDPDDDKVVDGSELESDVNLGSDDSLVVGGNIDNETNITGEADSESSFATDKDANINATLNMKDVENITLGKDTSISADTAFTLDTDGDNSKVEIDGDFNFEKSDNDKVAIHLKNDNITLSGDINVSSSTDSDANLTAIYTETGKVNLADGATVSAVITDAQGNESYGVAITNKEGTEGGLTIGAAGEITVQGAIIGNSNITISEGTTLNQEGSYITTKYAEDKDSGEGTTLTVNGTLVLGQDSNGNMGSIVDTGLVVGEGSIEVNYESSVSNLIGQEITVIDDTTWENNVDEENSILGDIEYDLSDGVSSSDGKLTIDSLSQFQDKYEGSDANTSALAEAFDSIDNTGDTDAKIEFKEDAYKAGIDSYISNGYSYISEVNSMLLSNLNLANVNRSRDVLKKAQGSYLFLEGDDSNESEYLAQARADAVENTSNFAQLQSINLLGSKDSSNGVAGYDYWSVGSLASIDKVFSKNIIAGMSLGGNYSKVSGDAGDNASSTAFLANFYTTLKPTDSLEVFANLGYAHFWNTASKGASSSEWDSDAINALVGISYDMKTGIKDLTLSPVAMINLVYLDNKEATLSGSAGDMNISAESYLSAKAMAGLELEYAFSKNFNAILRAMYAYEFGDDSYDYTYSFANGIIDSMQYSGGEASAGSAIFGLGLSYDFSEACTAYVDYNAYIYDNITTHSLNLSIGFRF